MYLIYCLTLFLFVYVTPALAVYPKLILSPKTVLAIPFVSIVIIALIKAFLAYTGAYSHSIVLWISAVFLIIASFRIIIVLNRSNINWPKPHQYIILFNLIITFYFFAELGTSSFASNDEIYSWNMWAIQHFQGNPIDLYYVKSPYPQLFPVLISYCYKVIGNIDTQLPVKALLAIFPFCLLTAIGIAPKENNYSNIVRHLILMFIFVVGIGVKRYFDDGLADPMMASALTVSIFLFIEYIRDTEQKELLWLSIICGIVAAYTKQTALLWIFAFPAIVGISLLQRKLPWIAVAAAATLFLAGMIWIFGEGRGFYNNQGAINASQQGRNLFEQLIFAANQYFIKYPLILLLFIASLMSVIRSRKHLDIFIFMLIPSLFIWFIFGAYSLRIGFHVLAMAALLLSATEYNFPVPEFLKAEERIDKIVRSKMVWIIGITASIVLISTVFDVSKAIRKKGDGFDLYVGGKNTIYKYFGDDAEFIFKKIYKNPDILLWIPSNYIYGIFYGHNKIMRPNYDISTTYNMDSLISEIKQYRPDYLFYAGPRVSYGPGSKLLRVLAEEKCPDIFDKIAGPKNKEGYIVYRLKKDNALLSRCH